ncbi:hypothetical protein [uncultured Duncaniella sp.]|nr:hypothetical protein [uncultured Duncaniella sp.]
MEIQLRSKAEQVIPDVADTLIKSGEATINFGLYGCLSQIIEYNNIS